MWVVSNQNTSKINFLLVKISVKLDTWLQTPHSKVLLILVYLGLTSLGPYIQKNIIE